MGNFTTKIFCRVKFHRGKFLSFLKGKGPYSCENHIIGEKSFFVIFRSCIKTFVNLVIQFNLFKIFAYGGRVGGRAITFCVSSFYTLSFGTVVSQLTSRCEF